MSVWNCWHHEVLGSNPMFVIIFYGGLSKIWIWLRVRQCLTYQLPERLSEIRSESFIFWSCFLIHKRISFWLVKVCVKAWLSQRLSTSLSAAVQFDILGAERLAFNLVIGIVKVIISYQVFKITKGKHSIIEIPAPWNIIFQIWENGWALVSTAFHDFDI
jgi:hypothetical protein